MEEGEIVWSEMNTDINGQQQKILANKKWGIIFLGDKVMALPEYPLISIDSLSFDCEKPSISKESAIVGG